MLNEITTPYSLPYINIRSDQRLPKHTEPFKLTPEILQQAKEIGLMITDIFPKIPNLVSDPEIRKAVGITEQKYEKNFKPFLTTPHHLVFFGADAILEENNQIKIIEINTRPQVLGRYDESQELTHNSNNNKITPHLKKALEEYSLPEKIRIISHPLNVFHPYHELFAKQAGIGICSLQELSCSLSQKIQHQGNDIDLLFREFSVKTLTNPQVTPPEIMESIQKGNTLLINGPLTEFLGIKPFLKQISLEKKDMQKYFPEMLTIKTGEKVNLKEFSGWWLKSETGGSTEFVIQLDRQYLQGWPKQVITAIIAGDITQAKTVLDQQNSNTAQRLRLHLRDMELEFPQVWLFQKNIPSKKLSITTRENEVYGCHSTLRLYFTYNEKTKDLQTFIELLASKYARVSGAGFTVPIVFNF